MKIIFLTPCPLGELPSQRFRFEQYYKILNTNGIVFHVQSFLPFNRRQNFIKSSSVLGKTVGLILGFIKRIIILFHVHQYDFVFIHREVTPFGPPIFEWVIAKVFKRKIIYDFDDAIWTIDTVGEFFLKKIIRYRSKVASICKWSHKVSCGNEYLCDYARQFNTNVVLNPTTIDTKLHHVAPHHEKKGMKGEVIIGWTGSHSTLKYLKTIEYELQQIESAHPNVEFHVIADISPDLNLKKLKFKPWSTETEISDLAQFDIGIMPLPDDEWSKGKCGFKILQYMALSIPSVASPVGVNTKIIKDGMNGFLCNTSADWINKMEELIKNESLRKQLGDNGYKTVVENYSVPSNTDNFLSLFR